jgi:hypothetical protein
MNYIFSICDIITFAKCSFSNAAIFSATRSGESLGSKTIYGVISLLHTKEQFVFDLVLQNFREKVNFMPSKELSN